MGEKVSRKETQGEPTSGESPLVRNKTMQLMYEGIVQSRMLEEYLRKRHKKARLTSSRGQEACRTSALIDLGTDDLVSDLPAGLATGLILGAELASLVDHADAVVSRKTRVVTATTKSLLPGMTDSARRLDLSLGAALALKCLNPSKIVVVFVEASELKNSTWKKVLHFAGREELPMLFVVLPSPDAKAKKQAVAAAFELSGRATAAGVPGIPVDASDAVALYRVAQESIGRARSGGGPALMECTHFLIEGQKKAAVPDPASSLGQVLLNRKICDEAWLSQVASQFKERLNALS